MIHQHLCSDLLCSLLPDDYESLSETPVLKDHHTQHPSLQDLVIIVSINCLMHRSIFSFNRLTYSRCIFSFKRLTYSCCIFSFNCLTCICCILSLTYSYCTFSRTYIRIGKEEGIVPPGGDIRQHILLRLKHILKCISLYLSREPAIRQIQRSQRSKPLNLWH